jgi:hypothetical protein
MALSVLSSRIRPDRSSALAAWMSATWFAAVADQRPAMLGEREGERRSLSADGTTRGSKP